MSDFLSNNLRYAVALACAVSLAGCSDKEDRVVEHMNKGMELYNTASYEKARIEFKNVLKMDPKHNEALYYQAQVQEKLENWRQAALLYLKVIEADPNHLDARIQVGRLFLAGKAIDRALEQADEVLLRDPSNVDGLVIKAGVRSEEGITEEAITLAEKALTMSPSHIDGLILLTSLHARGGDTQKAIELAKGHLGHHQTNTTLRVVLADLYDRSGNSALAEAALKEAIELEPTQFEHHGHLASYYMKIDKDGEAEAVLRKAVELFTEDDDAKRTLVDFYVRQNDLKQAEASLRAFIAKDGASHSLNFGLATLYERSDREAQAKEIYQKIIDAEKSGQERLDAMVKLATLQVRTDQVLEAKQLLGLVLDESSRNNEALILRGKIHLAEQNAVDAIKDFRAVLRDQPESIELLQLLAQAHINNSSTELAIENLRKGIELAPRNLLFQFTLAQLLIESGRHDEAERFLDVVLSSQPNHIGALEEMFKVHVARSQWSRAVERAKVITEVDPDASIGYYLLGLVTRQQGDNVSAIGFYEQALDRSPAAVEPLNALARTHISLNQNSKALARIERVLEEYPQHVAAMNLKGELLMLEKRYAEAGEIFSEAIELRPELVTLYRGLSSSYVARNDLDAAIRVVEQGIKSVADNGPLIVHLSNLYEKQGSFDKAITQYEVILKERPGTEYAINNLAMLLANYGEDQPSLDRAKQLADSLRSSDNVDFLHTVGWVYYKRGEHETAIPILEQIVRKTPQANLFHYHLGLAYYARGELDRARLSLQRALENGRAFTGIDDAQRILMEIKGA